ncbi:hypothetical protein [Sphaerochaeta sp. UBA5836]|uniref:hypothetical protein n=1 Tax=Sphaerochaeta sp. UBA5836 TaxID=1947474 RepID=UPI0025D4953B|nr:hypothetical protein [Sphaerochaeta sp. UBA5836]
MKRMLLVLLICLLLMPLFGFDLFFEEEPSRITSFTAEAAGGLYRDEQFLARTTLSLSLEQNHQRYGAIAHLSYDASTNRLKTGELSVSLLVGNLTVKGGLFTHPWGSAFTAHVVDVLSSRDLTDGFVDDLEAMKRPSAMVLLSSYGKNSSWDLAFKPGFQSSHLVTEGRYNLTPASFASAVITQQDTTSLSSWEAGGRYRTALGKLDVGLLYFNGHHPEPGFSITSFAPLAVDLVYTRHQLFGLESSLLFDPFTLALEGGFFLSEDAEGTDGSLYNSRFAYLAELSYTHPESSAFLALAYQGRYVLDFNTTNPVDVDYLASFNGKAYENTLLLVVEYPFLQQRLTTRAALTYHIESEGYALLAGLSYALQDNLTVFLKTTMYGALGNKSSIYASWDDNDSVVVGMKAWF